MCLPHFWRAYPRVNELTHEGSGFGMKHVADFVALLSGVAVSNLK